MTEKLETKSTNEANLNYICHSGGCPGSDMEWENECAKYGIKTIAYSFYNHKHEGKNPKVLTVDELKEGYQAVLTANKVMKRNPEYTYQYVKNLLSRNWFQVKNSDGIFAIGKFLDKKRVSGGTGWAVQMGIDNKKTIFVFNQEGDGSWDTFNYEKDEFEKFEGSIPCLYENFAGIGTREITEKGKTAIKDILEKNFKT